MFYSLYILIFCILFISLIFFSFFFKKHHFITILLIIELLFLIIATLFLFTGFSLDSSLGGTAFFLIIAFSGAESCIGIALLFRINQIQNLNIFGDLISD